MAQSVNTTYNTARAVTKSDSVELEQVNGHYPTALWVGGAGTVNVKTAGGETLDFAMAAGTVVPVQCVQVLSAGTTATGLRRVW